MSALANADESDDEVEVPPLAEPEAGKAPVSSTVPKRSWLATSYDLTFAFRALPSSL